MMFARNPVSPDQFALGRVALAGLMVAAALFGATGAAQARMFFDVGIGVPGVVVAPPVRVAPPVPPPAPAYYPVPVAPAPGGYYWVPGAYVWNGAGYVWSPGRYALPPWHGAVWVAGGWFRGPHGWAWRGGCWR